MMKNLLVGGGVVAIVLFLLVNCGKSKKESSTAPAANAAEGKPAFSIYGGGWFDGAKLDHEKFKDVDVLTHEYKQNEFAAIKKYKGQRVRIMGVPKEINARSDGSVSVRFYGELTGGMLVAFNKENADPIAKLTCYEFSDKRSEKNAVVVEGTLEDHHNFTNCKLIASDKTAKEALLFP